MALARWGGRGYAIAALAGAGAAGGAVPWVGWAIQAARDPVVREFAAEASAAGAAAMGTAKAWVGENVHQIGEHDVCVSWWTAAVAICIIVVVLTLSCVFGACCCASLGFIGGRAWALRAPPPSAAGQQLARLANLVEAGGQPALEAAASQLGVTPDAVRAWLVHWRVAHVGPRRA